MRKPTLLRDDITRRCAEQRVRLRVVSELLASRAWRTWQRDWLVATARARTDRNGTGVARGWAPLSLPPAKSSGHHPERIRLTRSAPRDT